MSTRIIKPSIAAFINFVKPLNSQQEARYIYNQFSRLGKVTWWHDHTSPAGFRHHGARSMVIYTLDDLKGLETMALEKENLIDDLNSIVGIPLLKDYESLQNGEIDKIDPVYQFDDKSMSKNQRANEIKLKKFKPLPTDVEVSSATRDEPFFVANMLTTEGYMSEYVQMKAANSIPLRVRVDLVD
ncbi:hypothetical protein BN7_1840 [Wickerhamomyces ciferrii]|uniref:Uncharacterized protein n=1 Tax=Wickerhamomyces ciferrii (strain ATCC 14091 / BCRC 22168 / CBS 111 / JCM 3599 / NBRC 0793 / NRRL Y-1031 F-60-10) TaxID=1206466 RepID=K0KH45_WICCF|nr:uncharacterized protein BN7_1840 [Wickerhamomyces ciferrii]CCH42296.1 hypothetical protein BN7_1840 [Wickerhamomyces ciferrii]